MPARKPNERTEIDRDRFSSRRVGRCGRHDRTQCDHLRGHGAAGSSGEHDAGTDGRQGFRPRPRSTSLVPVRNEHNRVAGLAPLLGIGVGAGVGSVAGVIHHLLLGQGRRLPFLVGARPGRRFGDGCIGCPAEAVRSFRPQDLDNDGLARRSRAASRVRRGHRGRHQADGIAVGEPRKRGDQGCDPDSARLLSRADAEARLSVLRWPEPAVIGSGEAAVGRRGDAPPAAPASPHPRVGVPPGSRSERRIALAAARPRRGTVRSSQVLLVGGRSAIVRRHERSTIRRSKSRCRLFDADRLP